MPSSAHMMYSTPGPQQVFPDREGSMEEQDDLSQGFNERYTALECTFAGERIDSSRIGNSDSQSSNLPLSNYSHPSFNQAEDYSAPLPHPQEEPWYWPLATRPPVLSPGQIPESGVQMTVAPGISDGYLGDKFGAFGDDQIHTNGSRPGRRIADQKLLQGANSPFNHWNGDDVQLHNPNLSCTNPYRQSSHESPQHLEYMADTHPEMPFEHHPGQEIEDPAFGEFRRIPEIEIVQSSEDEVVPSKKWLCPRKGCDKRYGRSQDVRRHERETHDISLAPRCFVCGFQWTRTEYIKKHLISKHGDSFNEEQLEKIRRLRGLNNHTIDSLERLRVETWVT